MLQIHTVPRSAWLLARVRDGWKFWALAAVSAVGAGLRQSRRGWDAVDIIVFAGAVGAIVVAIGVVWEGQRRHDFRERGGVAHVAPSAALLALLGRRVGTTPSSFAKAAIVEVGGGVELELDHHRWSLSEEGIDVIVHATGGGSAVAAVFRRGPDTVRVTAQRRIPKRLRAS